MTLLEAVKSISSEEATNVELSEDVIYARKPWVLESEALITPAPDGNSAPETAARLKMAYFLEVNIAKEVLEGAADLLSIEEKCQRVIQYAIMDA